jgi:HEAT repeat protein
VQDVLLIVILAIGGVFLALTLLILVNKAWRESDARLRRARRRELEPVVLRFIHGDEPAIDKALGGRPDSRDRSVLEDILLDHVTRVRGIERERLGRALDELGLVDEYIERLGSSRWWRRAEAAERLGLAGASRAIGELTRALDDAVAEVRMRAAKSLGEVGGTATARPLIAALNDPSRWSTIRIADILTSMGRPVIDELLDAWPGLTLAGKLAGLDIVGRIRPLRTESWLLERLDDPHPDIRARACHALGSIGDPRCGSALVVTLSDDAWPARAMAAKALGRVRYKEAIEPLCKTLRDPEWWVRANAAESLRSMGSAGIAALERVLDDEDNYARHQAVLMLQESGVVDQRIGWLARPDGDERRAAEHLVRRLLQSGQTGRLTELAAEHPDRRVRESLDGLLTAEAAS